MENKTNINGHILPIVRTKLNLDLPLYSETPIEKPEDVVNLLGSYMAEFSSEVVFVVCFDVLMHPTCVSIIGMGDYTHAPMPVRNVMQTALLSSAATIAIVHNHPDAITSTGNLRSSHNDVMGIDAIMKACQMMGLQFYDSIIISSYKENGKIIPSYYSMREREIKRWKKVNCDRYENGIIKSTLVSEGNLKWDNKEDASKYWGIDVSNLKTYPQITVYSPEELKQVIDTIKEKKPINNNTSFSFNSDNEKNKKLQKEYEQIMKMLEERD